MLREYFAVVRYLVQDESSPNIEELIYNKLESDLNKIIKFDRQNELKDMFLIVKGNMVEDD